MTGGAEAGMGLTLSDNGKARDILIPGETARQLLRLEGDAVRLYLFLCMEGCSADPGAGGAELGLDPERLDRAERALIAAGLACRPGTPVPEPLAQKPEEPPVYSKEELAAVKKADPAFAQIVREAEHTIKPLLTESDLRELMVIYGYLGMPADCLITLLHYVSGRVKARSGGVRRPSLAMIKREAIGWLDRGIVTLDLADQYIREESRLCAAEEAIAKALGMDAPTNDEWRMLRGIAELGYDGEAAGLAREVSVKKLGQAKLSYMLRVLKNWKSDGLPNAGAIRRRQEEKNLRENREMTEKLRRSPKKKEAGEQSGPSPEEMDILRWLDGGDKTKGETGNGL